MNVSLGDGRASTGVKDTLSGDAVWQFWYFFMFMALFAMAML